MAEPIPDGDGRWILRVFINQHPTTGATIRHRRQVRFEADGIRRARARARQIEADVAAELAAGGDRTPTVAQAAEEWWSLWCKRDRSPTTRKGYRLIVDNHIAKAPFAPKPVDQVKTGDVDRWYAAIDRSPATVRRIHAVLTQVFDQMVRDGRLDRNPATLAHKPEARPKAKTLVPLGTLRAVLAAAWEAHPMRARLLAFAALTGLRRGELCGLRWSAVDLDAGTLIVELNVVSAQERFVNPKSTSRTPMLVEKDPKAHQVAGIALDRQAQELIVQQVEWQTDAGVGDDPFLWAPVAPFDRPMHPDTATRWWVTAAKTAGARGVTLHDMRHWQGSTLLEVGATVQDVKERLRHKSLQTTMGYLHADHTKQRVLVQGLPSLELPS